MTSKGTTQKIAQKIDEVVCPYCDHNWCILKELCISKKTDIRMLIQLKCIEHLKFEESQTVGRDIKWATAHQIWIDRGFADAFAKYYDENLTAEQIYEKILKNFT